MEEEERILTEKCFEAAEASWNYNTNINDVNQQKELNASLEYSKFAKMFWQNLNSKFKSWPDFKDPDLKRRFIRATVLGSSALPEEDLVQVRLYLSSNLIIHLRLKALINWTCFSSKYNQLESNMKKTQSTTKVCAYEDPANCNLSLDPGQQRLKQK